MELREISFCVYVSFQSILKGAVIIGLGRAVSKISACFCGSSCLANMVLQAEHSSLLRYHPQIDGNVPIASRLPRVVGRIQPILDLETETESLSSREQPVNKLYRVTSISSLGV